MARPRPAKHADHAVVYRNDGEFCSWPFTMGFFDTGNSLIVNFQRARANYGDVASLNHNVVSRGGATLVSARSFDRGVTWNKEPLQEHTGNTLATHDGTGESILDLGPLDLPNKDTLIWTQSSAFGTPDGRPYVRVSKDAGRNWSPLIPAAAGWSAFRMHQFIADGAFRWPQPADADHGYPGRLVAAPHGLPQHARPVDLAFPVIRHAKGRSLRRNGWRLGQTRFLIRLRWTSLVLPAHRGTAERPHPVHAALPAQSAGRHVERDVLQRRRRWHLAFRSRINDFGAPTSLVYMQDGRLVAVYGYRLPPYGVRAAVSEDEGLTWQPEIILRDDGGSWDLGYPQAIESTKGKVMAAYYFNSKDDKVQADGGVRHIARTIFTPD